MPTEIEKRLASW